MKKKLMATTMVFALCAMASSAFASQGVTSPIKVNGGTFSNASISNGGNFNVGNFNVGNYNGGNYNGGNYNGGNVGGTSVVRSTADPTADLAKKIGVTEKQLLAYYEKYAKLNSVKTSDGKIKMKTLAERQAEINRFPASSQSEKLIKQWEQKQIKELIQQSKQWEQKQMNQVINKK
ncbi:hypothetical protein JNUCC42_23335 (plasmid) [Brevibacterium sp. JNUCC-42]|nr:hypothetical protein JNUCC42_23335 [Brevibacterium sp. JNUCC-42]